MQCPLRLGAAWFLGYSTGSLTAMIGQDARAALKQLAAEFAKGNSVQKAVAARINAVLRALGSKLIEATLAITPADLREIQVRINQDSGAANALDAVSQGQTGPVREALTTEAAGSRADAPRTARARETLAQLSALARRLAAIRKYPTRS
jgi:hypothetical protein